STSIFFFQAEDGIRDYKVTGVQTCALPIFRFNAEMNFLKTLAEHFAGKPIDWEELEESLIRADLGVPMTSRIIKTLQEREAWSLMGINDVVKIVRQEISRVLPANNAAIQPLAGKPNVILLLG